VKNSSISTSETTQSKLPYESRSKFINEITLSRNLKKHPFNDKTTATSGSSDKQQQQAPQATNNSNKVHSKKPDLSGDRFFPKFHFFSPNLITCIFLKIIGSWSNHSKRESNCGECSYAKSRATVKSEIAKTYANSNLTKNFPSRIVSLT